MNGKWYGWLIAAVLVGALVLGAGWFLGQATARGFSPIAGMMGSRWPGGSVAGGTGMMGGYGSGGSGMMGGYGYSGNSQASPLTIDEAQQAVEATLSAWGYSELKVGEVMIFDNGAYAEVENPGTGTGAFEVLVDPITRSVFLEYGPAMMWNVEYGMMGGRTRGMVGGMMGGGFRSQPTPFDPATAKVSASEAVDIAQRYLDEYSPGLRADEAADVFPGYYTLHTLDDGKVVSMLSVNAYTGQVWYHTWHGGFIEMSDVDS
jgi:hypothetical protein